MHKRERIVNLKNTAWDVKYVSDFDYVELTGVSVNDGADLCSVLTDDFLEKLEDQIRKDLLE